ncbi:MAG TPA: DNA-binding protein [Elusimicrobia bacterium]|nr:DNA-binding protein [Elusimicrobiota bacterium]
MPVDMIEQKILFIRGHRVMLDRELAVLYGVGTRDLNKAVSRNPERFPEDFMFQLNKKEFENLMFQSGTSSWGGTRKMPHAFTEHGILMLSSVLKSSRAIQVNIQVMRAFVKLRQLLNTHKELAHKLEGLEKKYDAQFKSVFDAIKMLMAQPPDFDPGPRKVTGFKPEK